MAAMEPARISNKDRDRLRTLAERQAELAALPAMAERTRLWYAHNSLRSDRPLVVVEMDTFEAEALPPLECEGEEAREVERKLLRAIVHENLIGDDVVVPSCFDVERVFELHEFGFDIEKIKAKDSQGREIGFAWEHPIKDLARDMARLGPSVCRHDSPATEASLALARDAIGDILPVRLVNASLRWHFAPTAKVVDLMGLEAMMYALLDSPDEMRELFRFIVGDMLALLDWQASESLLTPNNGNDYAGAGSYGFTDELPGPGLAPGGSLRPEDLWGNLNSQESVGISPRMYEELVFPSYAEIARRFGLVYYGCCEPVHGVWESCVSRLPGLRKVSVSPWCDEEYMGEALRGSGVIYSRKPSPNYLGVGREFDEAGFARHMERTVAAARGCTLEVIMRDVYTLTGDLGKPARAVRILRDVIDRDWD
jgi:hypothetical protein